MEHAHDHDDPGYGLVIAADFGSVLRADFAAGAEPGDRRRP
jgi:hypothetical protein